MRILILADFRNYKEEYVNDCTNTIRTQVNMIYPNSEVDIILLKNDLCEGHKLDTLKVISNVNYDKIFRRRVESDYAHGVLDGILPQALINEMRSYERIESIINDIEKL